VLGARSGSPDRTHTTPARGLSDLPPNRRITRVYRDLANNVPVAPLGATPRQPQNAQLFIGVAAAVAAAPATPHLSDGYERTCLGNGAYDEMLKTFTHAELERQQRANAAAERKLAPRTERCDADQC
jgi:hypothetical protein